MEYKELAQLYHMDSSSSRDANNKREAKRRLVAESTFRTRYASAQGELFIAVPRELSMQHEQVLRAERLVAAKADEMPAPARNSMLRSLVLDEIVSSNGIEGVRSTRRQIKDALNSIDSESKAGKRFKELATLYMAIVDETANIPRTPEDVRSLYDKVMDGELSAKDKPDGTLFRAHGVDVTDGIKVAHRGLSSEGAIIDAVNAMLQIASDEGIPALYRALASHYAFEYAHPFYDGNGRAGRYLLALYLSEALSTATTLSLSRTIAEHKRDYYKAFETAQNPLNHGELTHFVYRMLTLVSVAQGQLLERLDSVEGTLSLIEEAAERACHDLGLRTRERSIVSLLLTYEAFGLFGDAPLPEIARSLSLGSQMTRKHLSALEKAGVVRRIRKRDPVTYALADSFKGAYGIDAALSMSGELDQ